jgi:hypothetical protein
MITADAVLEANPTSSPSLVRADSLGPSADALQRLGILTPETLDDLCSKEARKQFVVEGLISAGSVGIVVGDSGIGKSPLLYQLGLSVAAGIPWLGMGTFSGPVVYLDCENGALNSQAMRDSLLRHLGLDECPKNFLCCYDISDIKRLAPVVEANQTGAGGD